MIYSDIWTPAAITENTRRDHAAELERPGISAGPFQLMAC
jgi:hypothetical protein